MNKTLIIGNRGRMGRRYSAILEHLGQDSTDIDIGETATLSDYSHVIVCTPTPTHFEFTIKAVMENVPHILCEKPVCGDSAKAKRVACLRTKSDIRVVCNWAFVEENTILQPRSHDVEYSNWMTGNDGQEWDCCQLYYLARSRPTIKRGPVFRASINGLPVTLTDIDRSYVDMLNHWYKAPQALWGLTDAIAMEQIVERVMS